MNVTTLFLAAAILVATSLIARAQKPATEQTESSEPRPTRSGRAEANGVNYYYEIYGDGEPLLLLHGGLGSIEMFGPVLPALSEHRQLIAVDLHGHGRTQLGDRPINPIDIGHDMAVVLDELDYAQVDVMGYSFGGAVAFRLAAQHPDRVRRLVIASAGFARDGFYPEMIPMQEAVGADMFESMKPTPMYQSYAAIAPDPDEFPELLDRMGEMMRKPYDWREDIEKLTMPVMLVYGDSDMIRLDHVVAFYQLLGGGLKDAGWQREHMSPNRLAILPNVTHYDLFFSAQLAEAVMPFLNGLTGAKTWSDHVEEGK